MLLLENICAGYDRRECIHDISLAASAGRLIAVIGPNGCGKSTLIKCMAGVLKPMSGRISVDGCEYSEMSGKERARSVSYMPQSRIAPDITVGRMAAYGRYPHARRGRAMRPDDMAAVESALERAGMRDFANRRVSSLSGGERQRAYIAMMLAQQSPVMLLDEPAAYLDISAQFSLMELLRGLCREGKTAVVVIHDLQMALEYADEALLMDNGRVAAQGSPNEILQSGTIRRVFGVDMERTAGGRYVFYPARGEIYEKSYSDGELRRQQRRR